MITPKRFREALGLWVGGVIAPIFGIGSALRQDRLFHPRGITFRAQASAAPDVTEQFADVAEALTQGDALVRLSPGAFTGDKGIMPDVLGVAIRFGAGATENFAPRAGSQDLLMASAPNVWTLPIAALKTNQRDFLANVYRGMAPFEIGNYENMRLRLVPQTPAESSPELDRFQSLRQAVADGGVTFRLYADSTKNPNLSSPLVDIQLVEEVILDEETLEFWPFRVGAGIRPSGFVQFMRHVPYLLSEYGRQIG